MPDDEIRPLFRTIVILGLAAVILLSVGVVEFAYFQPFTKITGTRARVEGVYHYDRAEGITGSPTTQFNVNDQFAAVVDWDALPAQMVVGARWYNSLEMTVGEVGPAPAGTLSGKRVVPIAVPEGLNRNLPGQYEFVVERFAGGQPVELLARRLVLVKRSP